MRKLKTISSAIIVIVIIAAFPIIFLNGGCEQSEGRKYGVLQKVSHQKFPCSYYKIEVAFEGGRVETTDGEHSSSAYSNTQEIQVNKEAYDSLQRLLGEKIIFEYNDKGFTLCGPSKELKFIQIKKK